jgi:flagellar hook-associated protein 3 FlgL
MSNLRIATSSLQESLVRQLNISQRNLVNLQKQIANGRRVSLPEDDPATFGRTIRRQSQKSVLSQYHTNNIIAEGVVKTSQLHLDGIRDLSDLALGIADSTGAATSSTEINGYHKQLDDILNQALDLANGKIDGEYLFAGVDYATDPYSINDNGTAADPSDDFIEYNGSPTDRSDPLFDEAETYVGKNTKLAAKLNPEHNEDIQGMLQNLLDLRNAYDTSIAPFDEQTVRTVSASIEASDDELAIASSDLISKQMFLNMATESDKSRYNQLDESIASEVGADLTSLAVQLKQTETSYQAALASASQILNISLLNYI